MILLFTDVAQTPGIGKYAGTFKIATELRNQGYPTQVIDCFKYLGINRLKKVLDKFVTKETLLIGVSNTLMYSYHNRSMWGITNKDFAEFVNYAKSLNPKIKFVVGGAGVSRFTDWDNVDYSILNKGSRT